MPNFNPNEVLVPLYNQYTSNAVPTTFVIAQSGARTSVTGTTSPTTLATVSIPAILGPNDGLRIYALFSCNASANAKTFAVRAAGTTIQSYTTTGSNQTAAELPVFFRNANSQTSQTAFLGGFFGQENVANNVVVAAVDTTAAFNVTFVATLANAGDTARLEGYSIEVLRGDVGTLATTGYTGPSLVMDFTGEATWLSAYTLNLDFVNDYYEVYSAPTTQGSYQVWTGATAW